MGTTYLRYFRELTKGIRFLQNTAGERLLASFILPFDGIADSARGGFLGAMPGHPEQHESSADQCGRERLLIKFGNEAPEAWKSYVQGVWDTYGTFTTKPGILEAVERWGLATFPDDWAPDTTTLTEDSFARFTITLPDSLPAFDVPHTFDDGTIYGDDAIYGSSGSARAFGLLRAAIRQAKPARSKGKIILPFATLPWHGGFLGRIGAPRIAVGGESELGRRVEIVITAGGARGVATYDWTLYGVNDDPLDGGSGVTASGTVALGTTGINVFFSSGTYVLNDVYTTVEGFNVITRLVINV